MTFTRTDLVRSGLPPRSVAFRVGRATDPQLDAIVSLAREAWTIWHRCKLLGVLTVDDTSAWQWWPATATCTNVRFDVNSAMQSVRDAAALAEADFLNSLPKSRAT